MKTQNLYTNNPEILPLTESLYACAVSLVRWLHSVAENGVDETNTDTGTELADRLITCRRNLQFALTGGQVLIKSRSFTEDETKPLPHGIELELRWVLFRADCISIDLLKNLHAGFDQEKIMSHARQIDDFVSEVRAAKSKIKKNIKKNAGLSSSIPLPAPTAPSLTDLKDDPHDLNPDYSHRDMCSDSQYVMWYFESLNRNGFMAGGIINLNRRMYLAGGDSEANRDDAYYSMLSVSMLFKDNHALTRAWVDAAKEAEQDHNRTPDSCGASPYPTTIDANTLASIDQITSQAINVLSSFTNMLAGVHPMTAAQYIEAFDSITSAINNINAVIDGSGDKSETHQA